MQGRCESLPIWVVLLYAFVHVVFNQEELLKAMLDKKSLSVQATMAKLDTPQENHQEGEAKQAENQILRRLQRYVETCCPTNRAQAGREARRCYRARRTDVPAGSIRFPPACCLRPLRRNSFQRPLEGNAEGVVAASWH